MALPSLENVEILPGPYEILELGDGGKKELVIEHYRVGRMTIHPRGGAGVKDIVALRVHVPDRIKPLYPDYYDITAQTLIAQMLPVLDAGDYQERLFVITKYGTGPSARFGLDVK